MQRMAALCEVWLPYSSPAVLISSTARSQPPSCTRSHSNHKCKAQDKAARATPCFVVQAQRFIAPGLLAMAQVMVHCPQLLTTVHALWSMLCGQRSRFSWAATEHSLMPSLLGFLLASLPIFKRSSMLSAPGITLIPAPAAASLSAMRQHCRLP